MQVRRAHRAAAVALLVLAFAGGCGQDGQVSLPTALPEGSVDGSPSISLPLPSLSRPEPTRTLPSAEPTTEGPTAEEPATPEPTSAEPTPEQPTETSTESVIAMPSDAPTSEAPATQEPTSEPPSPKPTEEPTTEEPATPTDEATSPTAQESATSATPTESTPEASASAGSPSPSETAPVDEDGSTGGLPVWLVLLGLAALVAGVWWFLAARSRRGRWDTQLEVERAQALWVVDELVPTMANAAATPSALAVHWAGAQATLDQLESGLATLVADPPDARRLESARAIAAAVADVRRAVTADLGLRSGSAGIPADPAAVAASTAVVQAARDRLAAAIATPA